MNTQSIVLKDKQGNVVDNNEIVYFELDKEHKFPLRRIVRWALIRTNKTMDIDCSGMGGNGDWGIDTFWRYFKEFYPDFIAECPCTSEFDDLLVEKFCL